jgi:2-succinyl-5-enolpyruvyl-6-hydroxy-3-cyclohexene-1-carboxylate synthase
VPDAPDPAVLEPLRDGHGSRLLVRVLVDELARGGTRHAVTSPGSRNTPILAALTAHGGLTAHSVVDERAAGFVALGLAKATGTPVLVCCTSGSAGAHLHPAVLEAHHARVPLIVLTADRPAELQDVGAGQTIHQPRLFGPTTRMEADLAVDVADATNVRRVRALAARMLAAAAGAAGGGPGPVHVNLPLREPLVAPGPPPALPAGRGDATPWVRRHGALGVPQEPAVVALAGLLLRHPRAVVVAGRHEEDPTLGPALAALCELLGLPLLADPLSGARRGAAAVSRYDALLRTPMAMPAPDLVLRLGDLPTSKPLRAWLAGLDADVPQVHVSADGAWQDPDGVLSDLVVAAPRPLLEAVAPRLAQATPDRAWLARWQALDVAAAAAQDRVLADEDGVTEPWLARELPASLPPAATLLVAASMPIRDVEAHLAPREALRVLANRGVNGIDGTIATAWGVELGRGPGDGPVCVLLGDVALQHDVGSLLAAGRRGVDLTVVLVDNDGGGIFEFLPVAEQDDPGLLDHVSTPTGLDVPALAAAAEAALHEVRRPEDLVPALRAATTEPRLSLLHVRTDRRRNRELHRRLEDAVRDALGD